MLFALSGLKGAGKDTAAKVFVEEYGFTQLAFADAVREVALTINPVVWADPDNSGSTVRLSDVIEQFGWDYSKRTYTEVRRLLQVIGTEVGRTLFGENVWIDILIKKYPDIINHYDSKYIITDCRFDNEANFVYRLGGEVIWIDRPGLTSDGHASESVKMKAKANVILHNDETIEELHEDIRLMLFMRGVEPIE